ncbi:MAG: HAD family hydrolase [Candidatus Sumerlaeaceae bacterium]|nr:HAD family hydrolase [Candidatus Sumerlaeaceae bacterium]
MQNASKAPAVFLDRDGTICKEVGYLAHPEQLELLPGSPQAIARLNRAGVIVIVTTNQSGVARGYFTEADVAAVHKRLEELLAARGAWLDAVYYCPHHPEKGMEPYLVDCECRKPKLGMIRRAQEEFLLDIGCSYAVGDKLSDVAFGKAAGLRTVLVLTGYGAGEQQKLASHPALNPDFIARDLSDAVSWIVNDLYQRGVLSIEPEALPDS